jgi:hypothetical protein
LARLALTTTLGSVEQRGVAAPDQRRTLGTLALRSGLSQPTLRRAFPHLTAALVDSGVRLRSGRAAERRTQVRARIRAIVERLFALALPASAALIAREAGQPALFLDPALRSYLGELTTVSRYI